MKKKYFTIAALLFTILAVCTNVLADNPQTKAEKKEKKIAEMKEMVNSKTYYFIAQVALPLSMPPVQLSYGYDLKVTADTLKAYLPYYGRAYTVPIGESDNGIKFETTKFEYNALETTDGWDITIKIEDDNMHNYQLTLSVSPTGVATLQINDNVRQSVSFNGYISKQP